MGVIACTLLDGSPDRVDGEMESLSTAGTPPLKPLAADEYSTIISGKPVVRLWV